jgi:DMSO/TMAO reductase YedYZ molybdopterin-dependent catalytic subunit
LLDTSWWGWSGRSIVEYVIPDDTVTTVLIHGQDQFTTTMWLQDFLQGMLAYAYNEQPLSPAHGFPLRFVAPPHLYQYKACKWVVGLEFLTDSAQVWENDRYANPHADAGKSMGELRKATRAAEAAFRAAHGQPPR